MAACSPPFSLPSKSDLSAIGIYNALDATYAGGMVAGSGGNPGTNLSALQDAVLAAIAAGGGTVLIPDGAYKINGTVSIRTADSPPGIAISVTIAGTSGKTELVVQNNEDLFDVTTSLDGTDTIVFQGV